MLIVKKLHPAAVIPTCAHSGEDLGFDLYALEDTHLPPNQVIKVKTGITVKYHSEGTRIGFIIRDRSSIAALGITVSGGVIDAGYTGEVIVLMTSQCHWDFPARTKIAQLLPMLVYTGVDIVQVHEIEATPRGDKGFGSTGQ